MENINRSEAKALFNEWNNNNTPLFTIGKKRSNGTRTWTNNRTYKNVSILEIIRIMLDDHFTYIFNITLCNNKGSILEFKPDWTLNDLYNNIKKHIQEWKNSDKLVDVNSKTGLFEFKNIATFENWRESEKLNKVNRLIGLYDDDNKQICDIEEGDEYGMRDKIVKAHHILHNGKKIFFEHISGTMNDFYNTLEFYMSDGKRITLDCKWIDGPTDPTHYNPTHYRHKEYFKMQYDNETIKIDPQWALDRIISNFGYGAQLIFVMVFYPNSEMYYNNMKMNLPVFQLN
jgi:hypothetical protein